MLFCQDHCHPGLLCFSCLVRNSGTHRLDRTCCPARSPDIAASHCPHRTSSFCHCITRPCRTKENHQRNGSESFARSKQPTIAAKGNHPKTSACKKKRDMTKACPLQLGVTEIKSFLDKQTPSRGATEHGEMRHPRRCRLRRWRRWTSQATMTLPRPTRFRHQAPLLPTRQPAKPVLLPPLVLAPPKQSTDGRQPKQKKKLIHKRGKEDDWAKDVKQQPSR